MKVYLESDVMRDLSGTFSEIGNCLNDLTDASPESCEKNYLFII